MQRVSGGTVNVYLIAGATIAAAAADVTEATVSDWVKTTLGARKTKRFMEPQII